MRLNTEAIRERTRFFIGTNRELSAATSVELIALCDRVEALEAALRVAVREMKRAENVGEVRFRTNALASGVAIGLGEALFTARAALGDEP